MKTRQLLVCLTFLLAPALVFPQTRDAGPWWPSQWGASDQSGATNRITPEKIVSALQLVETGRVYELGQVYEAGMPLFPGRTFSLLAQPLGAPLGENQVVGHDDFFAGQLGQVGTQFDGLGHIGAVVEMDDGRRDRIFYNGLPESEVYGTTGLQQLGIENVGPIITRGVLVDVAGFKDVDVLPGGYEITVDDVLGSLREQGMSEASIGEGDAVFIRTGWPAHWQDPDTYNGDTPGMGVALARWLVGKNITVTGGDTWPNEVIPNPDPSLVFPVHQELMLKSGVYNIENMVFDERPDAGVYEFLFIATPLRMKGATGSPLRPLAIR